jgi:hypothetical protein
MLNFTCASGESGDLFGATFIPVRHAPTRSWPAPALTTARVLCRRLRHNQALPEKQRIAHLICLNLLAMLRQDSPRARNPGG